MCQFCETEYESYYVPARTAYADDNLCEKIRDDNCTDCLGCVEDNYHFTLYSHHYRTDSFSIALGLVRKINDIIIAPTSETLSINYCPWCGRKLHNKDDVEFNKCCVQRLKHIER